MAKHLDAELVTVATFAGHFEASIARGALEAAGISAFVPGEEIGTFSRQRGAPHPIELRVFARDRERANELLKQAGHR